MEAASTQTALAQIAQALFNHEQWCEDIYRTLICRLEPDQRDMDPDAHRKCRFGQWYCTEGATLLQAHPGFAEIAIEHERMHQLAGVLLRASMERKPIPLHDYERFVTTVKRMRLETLTLKRELEDTLYNHDPLTGATNRINMLPKLREQLELVRRKVHTCCIAMMDLDNFKIVNDSYGHAMGDKVLTTFSRYAIAHLRPYDQFFRYGGEEFLFCMLATDVPTAQKRIDQLRAELGAILFQAEGHPPFRVTVSFGVTPLDPDASVEQSIDRADRALYAAKAAGRDRVTAWAPSMGQSHDLPDLTK